MSSNIPLIDNNIGLIVGDLYTTLLSILIVIGIIYQLYDNLKSNINLNQEIYMNNKFLTDQLMQGEDVKYEYFEHGNTWLATNKRIIKFGKGFSEKSFQDLYYRHIISITLVEKNYYHLLISSVILLLTGWILTNVHFNNLPKDISDIINFLGIFFILYGIILVIIGLLRKDLYCQFNIPSLQKGRVFYMWYVPKVPEWIIKKTEWRLTEIIDISPRLQEFIKTVREYC